MTTTEHVRLTIWICPAALYWQVGYRDCIISFVPYGTTYVLRLQREIGFRRVLYYLHIGYDRTQTKPYVGVGCDF